MKPISLIVKEAMLKVCPSVAIYKELLVYDENCIALVHMNIFVPQAYMMRSKVTLQHIMDKIGFEGADTSELLPNRDSCPITLAPYVPGHIVPGFYEAFTMSTAEH